MRREIEFKIKRDDGTSYEVRVSPFGSKFKFQFKEKGAGQWEYDRLPSREDLAALLDTIERRYARRRSAIKDVQAAEKLLQDFDRDNRPATL